MRYEAESPNSIYHGFTVAFTQLYGFPQNSFPECCWVIDRPKCDYATRRRAMCDLDEDGAQP